MEGIVKQHRGWIDCDSAVNRGTSFNIYLPRLEKHMVTRPETLVPKPATHGRETILLADDEPVLRRLASHILERFGYQVLLAEDGQDAVEVYERQRDQIDLVILDLTMPRLSGQDALKRLVQINPAVRVLFSSGYSAEQLAEGEYENILGFINKPYRADDMVRQLRAALDGASNGTIKETLSGSPQMT